jgi:hypothetical protein
MTEHRFEPFHIEDEGGRYAVQATIRTFEGNPPGDQPGHGPLVTIRFGNSFTLSAMDMSEVGKFRDLLDRVLAPGPQPWKPQNTPPTRYAPGHSCYNCGAYEDGGCCKDSENPSHLPADLCCDDWEAAPGFRDGRVNAEAERAANAGGDGWKGEPVPEDR